MSGQLNGRRSLGTPAPVQVLAPIPAPVGGRIRTAILSLLAAVVLLVLPIGIASAIPWMDDVDAALEEAGETGKPVLLLVTAGAWCDPCVWFDENALEEESVRSLVAAGFVPVRILDTEPGWESYGVQRLPTVVILESGGEELDRIDGVVTADVLRSTLAPLAAGGSPAATGRRTALDAVDSLRGAVFRIGSSGTLWNDGGANWYSQDAGLPPRLDEYDRDEVFLYLRDRSSATLLGVPLQVPPRGTPGVLWRWNLEGRTWEEAAELHRLD